MEPTNNENQPQTVKPDTLFTPSVSQGPPAPITPPSPVQPPISSMPPTANTDAKTKKLLIILGALVGVLVLIIIIVLLASSGNDSGNKEEGQNDQATDILSPPSAIDIENANNSVLSAITSLNDDNDFPAANLSDDNLQL